MLDWRALRQRANADGEFKIHARFWNGTIRIEHDSGAHRLEVSNGEITHIGTWTSGTATDLTIEAPDADWQQLLAPVPRPFYQDLYAAALHHGFTVTGEKTHTCAYYPALRRLIEIMREVHNERPI